MICFPVDLGRGFVCGVIVCDLIVVALYDCLLLGWWACFITRFNVSVIV